MMSRMRLGILLVLAGIAGSVFGQVTGSISGAVNDATGAAVPNAKIGVMLPGGKTPIVTTQTNNDGLFFVPVIHSDTYNLTVEASGFNKTTLSGVHVEPGKETPVPTVKLEVASTKETVEVVETAATVQTTSPQIATTITQQQLSKLPVIDGQISTVYITQAGVNSARTSTSINGLRPSFTNVLVDGIDVQDSVRTNALDLLPGKLTVSEASEVTIATSNNNPSISGNATVISIVTPSGGNQFHGTGYWFNRNSYFAANNWFNNKNGITRPRENLNQLGGTVGGPIIKDKLLFFAAYEAYRDHAQTVQNTTILTPTARQGIFQYRSGGQIQQFNILTAQKLGIDPYMQTELNMMPTTGNNTGFGDGLNTTGYSFNARNNETRDNVTGRLDYYLNANNQFTGIYKWTRDIVDRPDLATFFTVTPPDYNNINTKSITGSWRWSPRANLTNELRGGYVTLPVDFLSNTPAPKYFITNASVIFTSPVPEFLPQSRSTDVFAWQDNATWVHGRHTVSFGFQASMFRNPNSDFTGSVPAYNVGLSSASPYGFAAGSIPGASSGDITTANSLLQTLAGLLTSGTQRFNATSTTSGFVSGAPLVQEYHLNTYAPYVSDAWKIRRGLTLTLGLRWDYISPVDVKDSLFIQPRVDDGNVIHALLGNSTLDFAGSSVGRPLSKRDLNNFAPNVGFAWDVFGTGKTAIRGGYSIAYAIDNNWNDAVQIGLTNAGLTNSRSVGNLTSSASSPTTIVAPPFQIPTTALAQFVPTAPPVEVLVDPNLATPYVQNWHFGIQQEVKGVVIEARYVGNHAVKLFRQIDLNQINIDQSLNGSSYVTDFKNARVNGFLAQAATGTFNANYNPNIAGSQRLPFFSQLASGFSLTNATTASLLRSNEAGTLAQNIQTGPFLPSNFSFFANPYLLYATLLTNYSNSTYNAFQIEARKRTRSGLQFQGNYTFSKSLSDALATRALDPILNNASPSIEKARTPFDITHSFKVNHDYPLPFGAGQRFLSHSKALDRVVGGWSLTGFLHIDSGSPFSVLSATGSLNRGARSGQNPVDPIANQDVLGASTGLFMTGNGPYSINPANINPTDGRGVAPDGAAPFSGQLFFKPQADQVGGLQRRVFDGPMFWNYNFAVLKETRLTERQTLQFKAEFFNLFNHPNFFPGPSAANGDQTVTSTSFGRITTMQTSGDNVTVRAMRFGLTYRF